MTNQEKWIGFCQTHDEIICIYNKPFWLDAVCDGRQNWDVFLVEENGEIQAALPYYQKKRMGMHYITMPQLSPHSGIWLKSIENETSAKRIQREYRLYQKLIEQIETSGASFYQQCFSTEVRNWQPFYWTGYKQQTMYTFCINCPNHLDDAIRKFGKSTRHNIKKASEACTICEFDDVALFYEINSQMFASKNTKNPIPQALVERVYKACKEHDAVKMLCAKDQDGMTCGVFFLVYDALKVHALMCGTIPDKRSFNFDSALKFEGIKFACETGRTFDFEGSMIEGVANCMLRFGAEMCPYYLVRKVLVKTPIFSQYLKHKVYQ